jgi:hypothetical protein
VLAHKDFRGADAGPMRLEPRAGPVVAPVAAPVDGRRRFGHAGEDGDVAVNCQACEPPTHRGIAADQSDGDFGPLLHMPAGGGEHGPHVNIADIKSIDVDDHRRGVVEGGLDHRVAHLPVGAGI